MKFGYNGLSSFREEVVLKMWTDEWTTDDGACLNIKLPHELKSFLHYPDPWNTCILNAKIKMHQYYCDYTAKFGVTDIKCVTVSSSGKAIRSHSQ